MAEYRTATPVNTNYTARSAEVVDLAAPYGGSGGQEGALLNGLVAMGYDPALIRSLADADPNRRYLTDAITRALRAGIPTDAIRRALESTRAAATGDPQRAIAVLGVNPNDLPPDSRAVYDAMANRQPLPFLDRGQTGPAGASMPAQPVSGQPPAPFEQRSGGWRSPGSGTTLTGTQSPGAGAPGGGGPGRGTVTPTGASSFNAPATEPFPTDPNKVKEWLQRNAPEWAYLLDIPEVAAIVRDPNLWKEGADDADLRGRLMQTDWWKKTEPAARQWLDLKARDPAQANDQINRQITNLKNQAQALGITIPDDQWAKLAEDSLKFAWDDNETRASLGSFFAFDAAKTTGAAQAAEADLRQAASDWLVPLDDATLGQWVTQIVRGTATTDYFHTYLANQAQSLYPQLAEPISRGIPVAQYMNPYKTMAAQTLNMNPEDIDLRDPKWLRAISQVDDKGNRSAMTLYDWQNLLKTDDQYGWDKTQAGRDHGASLARGIAAQFGFATGGGL